MKDTLEKMLRECNYKFTNIEWHCGREGWYVLAVSETYGSTHCVNIADFVNEKLDLEKFLEEN